VRITNRVCCGYPGIKADNQYVCGGYNELATKPKQQKTMQRWTFTLHLNNKTNTMKKTLLLSFLIFNLSFLILAPLAQAQYTKLIDFAGATNGSNPNGCFLMQASDGMLYGMTTWGGANSKGVLFQFNPATSTYTKKLDFAGATNGEAPTASLMQASDGMLYGMTFQGGANASGVLFQYNPATNTYTKKLDFAGATNGQYPAGSLIQASDGMLYGMTQNGGANNLGVLFQYNPATNTYTKKLDFAGTTNGSNPEGSLIQASDGMLYGMTQGGGANSKGVLFQYNPATNTYTNKLDFAGASTGSTPHTSLMQASDGMLYGMTELGGANSMGVLFQYDPSTSIYTKELDFAGVTNGQYPTGAFMQASDGMLYGMTPVGGTNNFGVLFQYNPATSTYAKILDFVGVTNGSNPNHGTLMQASDGMLYGMTELGGANNLGVLFKYGIETGIAGNNTASDFAIFPNPFSTQTTLQTDNILHNATLTVDNCFGQTVVQIKNISGQTVTFSRDNLATGLYFVRLIQDNKVIAIDKLVIADR